MRKCSPNCVVVGAIACALSLVSVPTAFASGHGPVFGLATPTLGKGGWELDIAPMFREGESGGMAMLRTMLTYGLTPNFQLSISAPALFTTTPLPAARGTWMMPTDADTEAIAGWRFQRHEPAVGTRIESTAYFGVDLPGPQRLGGLLGHLHRAPGVYTAVATGLASRVNYFWAGIGDQYFFSRAGDQVPNTVFYSLVYGYRPFAAQQHYPGIDWRFFAEMTGEHDASIRQGGALLAGTSGDQIFLGPSTLVIYNNYAISAGIQWPVYRHVGPRFPTERYRIAVDFSYFF